jgi:hypothetical protein
VHALRVSGAAAESLALRLYSLPVCNHYEGPLDSQRAHGDVTVSLMLSGGGCPSLGI